MLDVFFYEAFEEEADALKAALPPRLRAGFTWKTIQESGDAAPPAPLISVRTQSVFPAAWAATLRGILTRSTGYDHVTRYRRTCGARVAAGYLPLYCARAVAEQAMLLWMALLRRLPRQTAQFATFHRDGLTGRECLGKRLLVVGVGCIGSEVCRLGMALGMDVRGADPVRKHDFVSYTTLEDGLPWADVLVNAMNLTAANRGLLSEARLSAARPGLIFVNVARGEHAPTRGLLRLLDAGRLGGVGLDVYNHESDLAVALRSGRTSDDDEAQAVAALMGRPDAILTPHNAFNTAEAVQRKARDSAEQAAHFLDHGRFLWPVPEEDAADAPGSAR